MHLLLIVILSLCLIVLFYWGGTILKFLLRLLFFILFMIVGQICVGISILLHSGMLPLLHGSIIPDWAIAPSPMAYLIIPSVGLISLVIAWMLENSLLLRLFILPSATLCLWHIYLFFTQVAGS